MENRQEKPNYHFNDSVGMPNPSLSCNGAEIGYNGLFAWDRSPQWSMRCATE